LTGLNTKEWDKKMAKVNEDVERIARELLETHAARIAQNGFKFERHKEKEREFQKSFPYIYTEDQSR
jgi:transcription-repair coupling factor (superfamily II helicase)